MLYEYILICFIFQANKAEQQTRKLKQTIEDIKYRYESKLSNKGKMQNTIVLLKSNRIWSYKQKII